MKKIILFSVCAIFALQLSNAQETTTDTELKSKKGIPILPQAGDFAIAVDASPFIDLVGNLTKINSGAAFADPSAFNFVDVNNQIMIKKYITAKEAYRAKVRISYNKESQKAFVFDDEFGGTSYNPADDDVIDKMSTSYFNIMLSAGKEFRRGYGRLQGFYGAEGIFEFGKGDAVNPNMKYKYGNDITLLNPTPTTYDFTTGTAGAAGTRTLKQSEGMLFGLGARAFGGVEYFFAPKMSVAGEFGWGLIFETQGSSKVSQESWDGVNNTVQEIDAKIGNGSEINVDTDNFTGCINLLFHF